MILGLWGASLIEALAYGFVLVGREPSAIRTIVKTVAVACLALLALLHGAPWMAVAGLAACAIGDVFLAGNPKRWLPLGLGSFLLGHVLYIFLFVELRDPYSQIGGGELAILAVIAAAAVAMLAFLWKSLGAMRPAVVLYVIAIAVMTGSSFLLDASYWPVMLGSLAFMASDAVLAMNLFRQEVLFGSKRVTDWAVWFLYYGAQVGIAWPFVVGMP